MATKNSPITAFVALIDITEDQQITELEEYLDAKGLDIEIDEEGKQEPRIRTIIEKASAVFCNPSTHPQELEGLLYCITSLLHLMEDTPTDILEDVCRLVVKGANEDNARHRLKLLGLMFCQFEAADATALIVLKHKLQFAEVYKIGHLLTVTLPILKKWMENWRLSTEDRRSVLTLYWNAIKSSTDKCCIDTLIEILSLHSSSIVDAMSSELATELIILALNDPSYYFFNNILQLEAVKNLEHEHEVVYKLLQLFVEGKLSSFKAFCEVHRPTMDSQLGINYNVCERKMQLLTLVSLSVDSKEVLFTALEDELQLDLPQIEQLVIDAIRQKLIKARIDHVNGRLVVMSCVHRTFGQKQWQLVYDRLSQWRDNISSLRANLKTLNGIQA